MSSRTSIRRVGSIGQLIDTNLAVGCDGSLRGTGLVAIKLSGTGWTSRAASFVQTKSKDGDTALGVLFHECCEFLTAEFVHNNYRAGVFYIERNFHGRNPKTTIAHAEAIGALIAAAVHQGWPVVRVDNKEAKAVLAQHGSSSKARMVTFARALFPDLIPAEAKDNWAEAIADAVGVAIAGDGIRRREFKPGEIA